MAGAFIVFEGGDGVGKSTQVRLLAQHLEDAGHEVVRTFEPGEGPIGAQIRHLLLSPETENLAPRAEALLFAADKAQHVHSLVRPALERGAVVLSDRYVDSTLAYQGAGRILDPDDLARINWWATGDLRPDLTVLLDLEPARGVGVKASRDRLEQLDGDFHQRVRQGFLDLAASEPDRYLVLYSRDPKPVVARKIRERVDALLRELSVTPGSMKS